MKKNLLLYILLIFLIVVNGFFLYNYLGMTATTSKNNKNDQRNNGPENFIVKALKFDKEQMAKLEDINIGHHEAMVDTSDEVKVLKDKLRSLITKEDVSDTEIDSILNVLGEKEKAHEKMMFNHLRAIRDICTDKQKQRFEKIIKDAMRGGPRPGGAGPNNGREGQLPPPKGPRGMPEGSPQP
jgi:protein CpxP